MRLEIPKAHGARYAEMMRTICRQQTVKSKKIYNRKTKHRRQHE